MGLGENELSVTDPTDPTDPAAHTHTIPNHVPFFTLKTNIDRNFIFLFFSIALKLKI